MSKRLGKMDMVVEKLRTFQESYGLMMQSHHCNPHDPARGVSVSLSVCPSIYSRISLGFFSGGGGGVRTSYCKGKGETDSNRSMW